MENTNDCFKMIKQREKILTMSEGRYLVSERPRSELRVDVRDDTHVGSITTHE